MIFLYIPNIHVVRDAYNGAYNALSSNSLKFLSALEKSGWLELQSNLIKGAVAVTNSILRGVSVLIHCSDGWDRTS